MARYLFAGTFAQFPTGLPAASVPFTVWTDIQAGSNVTGQLVGVDGISTYSAITTGQGNVLPFRGPDGYTSALFIDTGGEIRYQLTSPTSVDDLKARIDAIILNPGGGITDHGALSGLGDDDHPQYLNVARGDGRYLTQAQVTSAINAAVSAASTQDRNRANHSGTQLSSTISDFTVAVQAIAGSGGGGTGAVSSVAGRTGSVTLGPLDVGLGNVDNTSDASKPVSTSQQTALNLKANDASVVHLAATETITGIKTATAAWTFTSSPQVPTPVNGTDAANRAYVLSSIGQITTNPTYTAAAQGGSVDNRASINNVIAQVNANGGGSFRLGPGLHRLTGPLDPILANCQLDDSPGARITLASGYTGGLRVKITDGATTSGSTTLTSTAQAQFVSGDVGKRVTGIGIPDGTTITARASATSVTMSNAATATNTGVTVTVGAGIFTLIGKYAAIRTLQIIGGGNVGTEQAPNSAALNPFVGAAIDLGFGASFANVQDIDLINVNGWCLLAETVTASGLYGGVFDGIRGNYNAKGIRIAGNAANRDGQVFLDNLDLQVVTQASVLEIDGINDAQIGKINGCTGGEVNIAALNIIGNGSSIQVDNYDVGTFPTIPGAGPGIRIGGGTPNNVRIKGPVAQSGSPAVLIDGGFNISLSEMQVSRGGGAGVRITGGDLISLRDMTFARNGYTAGAGQCELEVTTTTGRVRVSRCDFTTPVGTASQQVDGVFKLPATNRVQIDLDNRYTGGHSPDQMYVGGNRAGQVEPSKTGYNASDYALAGWTYDPSLATGNTVLGSAGSAAAGTITGARIFVPEAMNITTLWVHVVTAGVTLTTGQNFAAIFNSAGTLVATTVDQTAGWGSSGLKAMALAAPVTIAAGWYDVGFWFRGTTGPAFARAASIAAMNTGMTGAGIRYWTADAGLTTAAPTTLGTKTAQSLAWWISAG